MKSPKLVSSLVFSLCSMFSQAEVILQYFETDWNEIYKRTPEIGETGYDAVWFPSPCKSPVAGTNKYANVGYSLYDRFDLGDTPQRGTLGTRYGTRGELREMVDALHASDVKIYPDIVFNHNGNGPNMLTYPGMKINDFHVWQDASQPGGWKRAPRMTAYDDINNGFGGTFQQELVSLIDLQLEPDGRFTSGSPNYAAEPTAYVRHPGQYEKYPFNPTGTLPNENVRQMMARWAHWLGNSIDYDGFRLDAGKHVIREFYGGPGSGFLHEAQWNFDQRRGNTYNANVPDLYTNEVRRKDMLMFNEIFAGASTNFDYWRQGSVKMRYLDFPAKQQIIGNAFSSGNLGSLSTLGVALDPTEGVSFVHSHDQSGPTKMDLAYAWLLTRPGVPVVYFSGNNISWTDKNSGKTWVLPGTGNALGDFNGVLTNLIYINNQFARGKEWNRWADNDFYATERYVDGNSNSNPDSGEGVLLVALNDGGYDQTKTLQTSFPSGTVLKDYTGNQPSTVTVNGSGQVTITVPNRGGQGFVCYAPYIAEGSGEPIRFTSGGTAVGTMPWVVPGGRDATAKTRAIPRITSNSVDINVYYTNPIGGSVNSTIIKWGQGRNLNASATDFTGADVVTGGYEQATYDAATSTWKLTADMTNVPEGLHTIKARLFNSRAAGLPALYQTFSKTVYVDRSGPAVTIDNPAASATVNGDVIATITNADKTAGKVEVRVDGGAWTDAVQFSKGTWKANLTGLSNASHTMDVRATEYDQAATPSQINQTTVSRTFTVSAPAFAVGISYAEGATINLPFFKTDVTLPSGSTASDLKLYWDGLEMTGFTTSGQVVTHTFDGRYVSGGVTSQLYGAFVNGKHHFEAVVTNGGNTKRICRTVTFNLYGNNSIDSDGDGLPDGIELPGFDTGNYATQSFPGDGNEDTIPNNGENWTRTNPLNQDTNYNGVWDGDEDWDSDGVTNFNEVKQGYLQQGNPSYFNVYNAASKPTSTTIPSSASWTLSSSGGTNTLNITYKPNDGVLTGITPISVVVTPNTGSALTATMTNAGSGNFTYSYTVPAGVATVSLTFKNSTGSITDTSTSWNNIPVNITPPAFTMNGTVDSANYLVADNGMRIWAAVKGTKLYFATWSADGATTNADHYMLVSNNFGNTEPNMWAKAGNSNFWFAGWPYLAAESGPVASTYYGLTNGGASGRFAMGTAGNVLEGEIDLVEKFGAVPPVIYMSALAFGNNDGDGILSQCPAAWSADNDVQITEMAAIRTDSIRDEDADGYFDRGNPTLTSTVAGDTADANYGLRRFFIDELSGETFNITLNFTPNINPGETISNVEIISNINRRDKATIQENLDLATTSSNTYSRAYPMTNNAGVWSGTITASKCGAYRATVRYFVDGQGPFYYTDHGLRRDLSIVVSPKKALALNMYEVNPAIVEATNDTFAGRSTFRDMWMANTDRPDVLNLTHFKSLGTNMVWLQPVHPIGVDGRENDPTTSAPYDPGSPYAVKNYWKIAPSLGADNSDAGALAEFQQMVSKFDEAGIGVMMDGTFNHSAPDAVLGEGATTLFSWAQGQENSEIRNTKPQWFSKTGNYLLPASTAADIAVAPDRSDFGKWNDVRDFYFGNYDTLVKYASTSHRDEFLLERDQVEPLSQDTVDLWNYFALYPLFWLERTGHPAGTSATQSQKGIDGLRCDFAQGLPSEFWEYCINKTRNAKWDFIFMAESLDGYREVNGSKRHGVGYRSARHFDVLNENIVFYWRDTFFAYPANGPGSAGTPVKATANTFTAFDNRKQAFEGIVLLNNLTSHDEVFPSNDGYSLLHAYAQVSAMDGIPMIMYGQEAGAKNNFATYGFTSTAQSPLLNTNNNWARYETNFGKTIPNFKRWNFMSNVWNNRDWTLQDLYGRVGRARAGSVALRSNQNYFLARTSGGWDPDIFAVAKFTTPGVPARQQEVVFAFVNNDYQAAATRTQTYSVNATTTGGANWFGIESGRSYNVVNLLAANPAAYVWGTNRTGADIIANGINITLNSTSTLGQAQYLKLVDTTALVDSDGDGMPDEWEVANGLNPSVNDANADLDGDCSSNLTEYLAGTSPNDRNSLLAIHFYEKNASVIDLTWKSVAGKAYKIQWSENLTTWNYLNDGYNPIIFNAISSLTSTTINLPSPIPSRRFFRVITP